MSIPQLAKKKISTVLNRAVAQRIHPDADRQAGQRIVVFGARQHRSLLAQPPDVAEKSKYQQRANANSNADLCPSESHPERNFIGIATYRKITSVSRDRTCTSGES